jgi:hypothetical protein
MVMDGVFAGELGDGMPIDYRRDLGFWLLLLLLGSAIVLVAYPYL